jgi:Protein of unknown function (DUF4242)
VGDDSDLRLFLVEHDLHGLSPAQRASAHLVLEEAVCRACGRGKTIRYVQRILAAGEPRCLCLFLAPGPETVRSVNDIAQLPLARIAAVTSSVPDARPQKSDAEKDLPGRDQQ